MDKSELKATIQRAKTGTDAIVRREALIELGYGKQKEIYPVLVDHLDDGSSSIQHAAVISLGRFGDPTAIEEIIKPKILNSPIVNVRWAAVAALGKLGDSSIIDHLLKAVNDPEWIVRNQAVSELKDKIRKIIQTREIRSVRILIRLLTLEDEEIIDLTIDGLVEMGRRSAELLLTGLRSPSPVMRKNSARALGRIGDKRAVPQLIELIHDHDWRVREESVRALGLLQEKSAIEHLVVALGDNVPLVQKEAVESLIRYGRLSTMALLNALNHEKNKYALRSILIALGHIGDIKAVPALIDHLRSSYFVVRIAAIRALIPFGHQVVEPLIKTLSTHRGDIRRLLQDSGQREDPHLQLRAVNALGGLEEHRAVSLLKTLVQEGWPEVQEAASKALIQIGCAAWGRCGALMVLREIPSTDLTPHLLQSLEDDSDNVRFEAIRTLAKLDPQGAIDPLIRVAQKDRDSTNRFEAVRQLRRIGVGYPQVLDLAMSALKDKSGDVRSQAARLLGNFQDEKSIPQLLNTLGDPHWSTRESAEIALENFGAQAVPTLLEGLKKRKWTIRFRIARILGEIGDIRAVGPLESLLDKKGEHTKVVNVARAALKKLRGD